jgi:hypothetical protein
MKTLSDLSLRITEEEYREIGDVSYSLLSSIDRLGAEVKTEDFQGNKGTQMGTLIEELVIGGYDATKYYIGDAVDIGDTLITIINEIFQPEYEIELNEEWLEGFVLQALIDMPHLQYYNNWKNETRAKSIVKNGFPYIKSLVESRGKISFTNAEFDTCVQCAVTLKSHAFTGKIFKKRENVDTFAQFKGTFNIHDITVRFMVDFLEVDHNTKTVTPYDIKTGNKKPENFQKSYHYWRYDIQDYIYTKGVTKVLFDEFPHYTYNPVHFIYINTVGTPRPLIYKGLGTNALVWTGYKYDGWKYKGISELIDEYVWYKKHNFEIDFPEKIYNSEGKLNIESFDFQPLTS